MTQKRSASSCITINTKRNKCYTCLNILVVDDNPINIILLKKCLDKLFHHQKPQIKEAYNGIEALELVNEIDFDIILLDIDMPLLNGIDTTKYLRKKGQTIPIIAITTNDSIESRINYSKIGINDCLSKPVDLQLLEKALHLLL